MRDRPVAMADNFRMAETRLLEPIALPEAACRRYQSVRYCDSGILKTDIASLAFAP